MQKASAIRVVLLTTLILFGCSSKGTEIKKAENHSSTFVNLPEKTRNAYKPISPRELSLPEVTMVDKEKLKLTTAKGSRTVDLEELSTGKPLSERLIIKLFDSTEEDFLREVWDLNESHHILLFAKQDLSKITAVENDEKVLSEAYLAGKIADYATLFKSIGSEDIYEVLNTGLVIFNKKLKKTAYVEGFGILSNDAKQVLLEGESLEEGTQKIIGLESYLEGTKKNEKSFEIDGKAIARTAGLKETANLHSIDTLYMVEDFIVLRLTYNNYITDAGATNVLVDLSENKPQMYEVDLGYKIGS